MVAPGGYSVRPFLHKLRGVKIGNDVWVSQYVYLDEIHPEAITVGANVSIGLRTTVIAHLYWGPRKSTEHAGPVHIGDDVFVGPHCVILPNVTIGTGAVIVAGTTVSQNVPPHTVWGVPRAGPLATATVPLTHEFSYELFRRGLKSYSPPSKTE
jgi:acetyltransferase-like isoleucine patch superfamily enzyme